MPAMKPKLITLSFTHQGHSK